jgi:hypothetical protein
VFVLAFFRSVADGTRSVENDLGRSVGFGAVDGGEGVRVLGSDVAEDGGAASGDAVLCEKDRRSARKS